MGIRPVIKPGETTGKMGPFRERKSTTILRTFEEKEWSRIMCYCRRWAVETAYPTYKAYTEKDMPKT